MKRWLAYGALCGLGCEGLPGEPVAEEPGASDVVRIVGSACPERNRTEAQVREAVTRHIGNETDELSLVEVYNDLNCLTLAEVGRFAELVLAQSATSEQAVVRKAELALVTLDYAGRQLSMENFLSLAQVARSAFPSLLEQKRLHVARGQFLERPPAIVYDALGTVDPASLIGSLRGCNLQEMRVARSWHSADDDHGEAKTPAKSGADLCPGRGRRSTGPILTEAPELSASLTRCLEQTLAKTPRDLAVCIGSPSLGEGVGLRSDAFCDLAGSETMYCGLPVCPTGKVGFEKGRPRLMEIGLQWTAPGTDAQARADAARRADAAGQQAKTTAQQLIDSEGELEAARKELAKQQKKAQEHLDKGEVVPASNSPVVTKKLPRNHKELETARQEVRKKESEVAGHKMKLTAQQVEEANERVKAAGDASLCEAHMETCRTTCTPDQADSTFGRRFGGGVDASCAAGRRPLAQNEGTTDPPDPSRGFVYTEMMRCLLDLDPSIDLDASPDTCTQMLCEDGRSATRRDGACSCRRAPVGLPESGMRLLARCNQQIVCTEPEGACTCEEAGGPVPVLPRNGGRTLFRFVAVGGEDASRAIAVDLAHPPVAIGEALGRSPSAADPEALRLFELGRPD